MPDTLPLLNNTWQAGCLDHTEVCASDCNIVLSTVDEAVSQTHFGALCLDIVSITL